MSERNLTTACACLSILLLGGLSSGCATTAQTPAPAVPAPQTAPEGAVPIHQSVRLEGELTDNGMGCTALRTADGRLYTFARDLEGTKKGERIWVEGNVVKQGGCAVGVSVMPHRAGLVAASGR